jgi:phage/plasmid-associated DNA primase
MAKEDNFSKYQQIRNKYKYDGLCLYSNDFISNLSISEKISEYLKNQLVFCNKKWYAVKENLWIQDVEPTLYIYKCIEAGTQIGIEKINSQINKLTDQEQIGIKSQERETLLKNRKKIDTSSTMGQIIKCLKELLTDNEFDNILDKQPYKIAFKNGIYDITNKKFRMGIDPTDYLTKTLDFDYTENMANEEDGNWLSNQLYKLCNCDESQKEYFMSIISYCLSGDSSKYQHFYGAIGQKAGNGKSTIISILSKIMPNYVKVANSQMLESDFKNKHKFLPDLERYRFVAFEEMRKGKKIDTRIFKTIADGMVIDNEVMFGTNKKINVNSKCILISNHTPDFDEPDEGANRRYTHFQFDSEFRPEYKTDDYENKKFIAINNIEEEFIKRKETLIWFILELANNVYHNGLPEIPEYYKNEKKEIMDTNFVFKTFINEFCEIGHGLRVSKKELVDKYYMEKNIKIDDKTLRDEMKGLGYEYNRELRHNGNKAIFIGLKLKEEECLLDDIDVI